MSGWFPWTDTDPWYRNLQNLNLKQSGRKKSSDWPRALFRLFQGRSSVNSTLSPPAFNGRIALYYNDLLHLVQPIWELLNGLELRNLKKIHPSVWRRLKLSLNYQWPLPLALPTFVFNIMHQAIGQTILCRGQSLSRVLKGTQQYAPSLCGICPFGGGVNGRESTFQIIERTDTFSGFFQEVFSGRSKPSVKRKRWSRNVSCHMLIVLSRCLRGCVSTRFRSYFYSFTILIKTLHFFITFCAIFPTLWYSYLSMQTATWWL